MDDMNERQDRIEGLDGEQWASWLVEGQEEYENIESGELKNVVRRLARRPDALTPGDKLLEYYEEIEDLERQDAADASEAGLFLVRIADRFQELEEPQVIADADEVGGGPGAEGEEDSRTTIQRLLEVEEALADPDLEDDQRNTLEDQRIEFVNKASFREAHELLTRDTYRDNLSGDAQDLLVGRVDDLVERASELNVLPDIATTITSELSGNGWNNAIPRAQSALTRELQKYQRVYEEYPELQGIAETITRGGLAQAQLDGIIVAEGRGRALDDSWVVSHGYGARGADINEVKNSLAGVADRDYIVPLWGEHPGSLVGTELSESQRREEERRLQEERRTRAAEKRVEQEERDISYRDRIQREVAELKEQGETPEAWLELAFRYLDEAESLSLQDRAKSNEANEELWAAIEEAIAQISDDVGEVVTADRRFGRMGELAAFHQRNYPEGLKFKDRLKLYYTARRRLNDRYIEVEMANGNLVQMGKGSEDIQLKGIKYEATEVEPQDWMILFMTDEVFHEIRKDVQVIRGAERGLEQREALPNVDRGMSMWWEAGLAYGTMPDYLLTASEKNVIDKLFRDDNVRLLTDYYRMKDHEKLQGREPDRQWFWPEASKFQEDYKKYMDMLDRIDNDNRRKGDKMKDHEERFWRWVRGEYGTNFRLLSNREIEIYGNIPTFKSSLNSAQRTADLRNRLRTHAKEDGFLLGNKGEELAYRLFTISFTRFMLDRERVSVAGREEPRDLMWMERARVYLFGKKLREPGMDWSIGRFWAQPDQADQVPGLERKHVKGQTRHEMLEINSQRFVFGEGQRDYSGQLIGDYFHTAYVNEPDVLKPGNIIKRKLSEWVISPDGSTIENGWKNIPWLSLSSGSYAGGYFGYMVGTADRINGLLTSQEWQKPFEMAVPAFWQKRRERIADKLEIICPWLTTAEHDFRVGLFRDKLREAGGIPEGVIARLTGYSDYDIAAHVDRTSPIFEEIIAVRDNRAIAREIVEQAEEQSKAYVSFATQKFQMVDALAQVWPGTLHALSSAARPLTKSIIEVKDMEEIIRALEASKYVVNDRRKIKNPDGSETIATHMDFMDQFRREVWREMGIGERWSSGRTDRYQATRVQKEQMWGVNVA